MFYNPSIGRTKSFCQFATQAEGSITRTLKPARDWPALTWRWLRQGEEPKTREYSAELAFAGSAIQQDKSSAAINIICAFKGDVNSGSAPLLRGGRGRGHQRGSWELEGTDVTPARVPHEGGDKV